MRSGLHWEWWVNVVQLIIFLFFQSLERHFVLCSHGALDSPCNRSKYDHKCKEQLATHWAGDRLRSHSEWTWGMSLLDFELARMKLHGHVLTSERINAISIIRVHPASPIYWQHWIHRTLSCVSECSSLNERIESERDRLVVCSTYITTNSRGNMLGLTVNSSFVLCPNPSINCDGWTM